MASKKSSKKAKAKKAKAKKTSAKKASAKKASAKKVSAKKLAKKIAKKASAKKSTQRINTKITPSAINYSRNSENMLPGFDQRDHLLFKYGFDIRECEEIIASTKGGGYHSISEAFQAAAEKAQDESNEEKKKYFDLLSSVCGMLLRRVENNDPFIAAMSVDRKRIFKASDFSEDEINFLLEIAAYITSPILKARLADIVWIRQGNKDYAKLAIEAYISIPIETHITTFRRYNFNNRARALTLALMLKEKNVISSIKAFALKTFLSMHKENRIYPIDIVGCSRLLLRVNTTKQEKINIAIMLGKFGRNSKQVIMKHGFHNIFIQESLWYKKLGNEKRSYKVLVEGFDIIKKSIEKRTLSPMSHRMLSRTALDLLEEIPPHYILEFGINERIREFKLLLEKTKEDTSNKSLDTSPPLLAVGIRKQVDEVIKYMQGKDKFETLSAFANLSPFMSSEILKDKNVDSIAEIADLNNKEENDDKNKNLINKYRTYVKAITQTLIIPALKIINDMYDRRPQNYRSEQQGESEQQDVIDVKVFYRIASESSIIRDNSISPFAKGLFAGYESDYITALSILAPQLEAMVRYHLQRENISTTKEKSAKQLGLWDLLGKAEELSEGKEIFGENSKNIIFELKSSFCNHLGANLRNEVSHGLIKQDGFSDTEVVYAWWLVFSIVFKTCDQSRLRSAIENSSKFSEST